MSPTQPATKLLTSLAEVLEASGTRWYVFGAQAVILWGSPRMSADVDVTVQVDPSEISSLIAAMEEAGFRLRTRNVEAFVAQTRVLPFLHLATRMPLDMVLAGPGLEQLFLERAHSFDLDGKQIPVIAPEDLIVGKVLAGRPKDVDDVSGILRERGDALDLEQIRGTLRLLEEALSRGDLLPVFEDQVSKIRRG